MKPWRTRPLGASIAVAGCQTRGLSPTPAQAFATLAHAQGLAAATVTTAQFRHRLYYNAAAQRKPPSALHVYVEHDGQPWQGTGRPHRDPTPRMPIALWWLVRDPHPGVLVGRPGYHGARQATGAPVHPWHWTHGRYSAHVVMSLRAVVAQLPPVTAVAGHSGGGQLAVLLTAALVAPPQVVATTAANFDHRAWTAHFGDSPLRDSLAAVDLPPLPPTIRQVHWLGGRDRQVLPAMTTALARRQPTAQWRVQPDFDHHRDWAMLSPSQLFFPD